MNTQKNTFSFLIHTHTDCIDAFEICIGQLNKYFPSHMKYVLIDQDIVHPNEDNVKYLTYDNTLIYTERFIQPLREIKDDKVLFLHEDMILYDTPDYEEIERVGSLMDDKGIDFIKFIASLGIEENETEKFIRTQNGYTFAIQPTLWKRNSLLSLMQKFSLSIWDLELYSQEFCRKELKGYTYFRGNEKLRGQAHFDSFIFPYTATGIDKGKWNYLEYSDELSSLLNEYGVGFDRETNVLDIKNK